MRLGPGRDARLKACLGSGGTDKWVLSMELTRTRIRHILHLSSCHTATKSLAI